MAVRTKTELKALLETGDPLIESTFIDLIDSLLDLDTGFEVVNDFFSKLKRLPSFLTPRQYFNKSNIVHGEVINTVNGVISVAANWIRMDAIPVEENQWYTFIGQASRFDVHAYSDISLSPSSWIQVLTKVAVSGGVKVQIPAGGKFISANIAETTGQHGVVDTLAMFPGEVALPYKEFGFTMDASASGGWEITDPNAETIDLDSIDDFLTGKSLEFPSMLLPLNNFDKRNAVENSLVDAASGVIQNVTGWLRTGKVPVLGNQVYTSVGQASRFDVHAYDENDAWLGKLTLTTVGAGRQWTTPANTQYIIITIAETAGAWGVRDTLCIKEGSTVPIYKDFSFGFRDSFIGGWVVEGGGGGTAYDQDLNTTDDVTFASIITDSLTVTGSLPTGTLASPPSGLQVGDYWADTTDSTTHPTIRQKIA